MLRRNARLRREYLYRKSLEGKDKVIYEKKRKLKEAIAQGKAAPTEFHSKEVVDLKKKIELEDESHESTSTHIDDEYGNAGVLDPKILLTTSRDPSTRLVQFVKELRLCFPTSQRINRGNTVLSDLIASARGSDITDVVIIHEHRGEPDGLIVSHLPHGPTAYFGLRNVVLRHDLPERLDTMSEAYPHLIFDNFRTPLGERLKTILQHLFPVPKEDSKRVLTFANRNDSISFRHHVYKKTDGKPEVGEVGPRFELNLYQIKLGTIDMAEAENEWVLRPYMNTAHKRKSLA